VWLPSGLIATHRGAPPTLMVATTVLVALLITDAVPSLQLVT
jgi:hypothetical protein